MAIDYRRLLRGLAAVSELVDSTTGLPAVELLLNVLGESSGAVGATFVEYDDGGARVLLATGTMAWSVGRHTPSRPDLEEAGPEAMPTSVDRLEPQAARSLHDRGMHSFAWARVVRDDTPFASIVLLFGTPADAVEDWPDVRQAMNTCATFVRHLYEPPEPTRPGQAVEGEDRALFLAVAGHELRTPVTVVKGYASMLANRWEALGEIDRREAAHVLMVRSDELARLVDRLLRASIGDGTGGWLVRIQSFDPADALHQAVGDLPPDLRRSLLCSVPPTLPPAMGDPRILTSIVAELVTNAVRSTPTIPSGPPIQVAVGDDARGPGHVDTAGSVGAPRVPLAGTALGPQITLATPIELEAEADAHTVVIRVCDRGVGIDPAEAAVAFDRFWSSSRSAESRPGVGLGLYLVRRLVERQNGWVSLRPREGGGSVAEVRLHRADAPPRRPIRGEV
jgi:signal transduction histidine kinase